MKKFAKLLALVMVMALVMSTLTACGAIDKKKVLGDWSIATINGMTCDEYAASLNLDANMGRGGLTITEDNIKVVSSIATQDLGKYECLANGIQVEQNGQVVFAAEFDEKADTLTMKQGTSEANAITFVYKRGTVVFAEPEVADEEYADEEYYEEEE